MPAGLLVLMFAGLIAMPAAFYLYLTHPAWSWLYLLDPAGLSDLLVVPVAIGQASAVLGAWSLGALLCRRGRMRVLPLAIAAVAVILAGLILGLANRLGVAGSYQAQAAGLAAGLMETRLGYALIALTLGQVLAALFVSVELTRDSRRARLRSAGGAV